ncbi:MAG: two-component sensor histidine kinase BarA [Psychromonas sp.]|nr:two-component sensor histidine kinase BarA [Psychromonas sp.]
MAKYGLRSQVITYTLLPTIFIGGLLASYFLYNRYHEANRSFINNAINIAEPLAIACEYGMHDGTREILQRLISLTHRKNSEMIKSIAIFDAHNKLFVTSNYHSGFHRLQLTGKKPIPDVTQVRKFKDEVVIFSPITNESNFLQYNLNFDSSHKIIGYISLEISPHPVELLLYRDASISLLIVFIGILGSLFFALKQARRITEPVSQMAQIVEKISLGRLNSRVYGEYNGELQLLKDGINEMAVAMSKHHSEMQDSIDLATSELRETLDQMEIQNIEIDITRKEALEASMVKSDFLANMSHELRTPLNGVIGFTRQLLKTQMNEGQVDYLQTIERSAGNLLTIINDILDFSKLEAGKLKLESIPFNLRDSIHETMLLLAASAHEKDLELSMMFDPAVPENVIGDSMRLQQIMTNLIGNAIKFTQKGNIDVKVQCTNTYQGSDMMTMLKITISDTGIGISQDQQSQLFKPFGQADSSITRQYGGTGLGLVITKKLVDEMGGRISLSSKINKGTIFSFTINFEKNNHNLLKQRETDILKNKSVLLFDANRSAISACAQLLEQWKMNLILATTKQQFIEHCQKVYDSIIIGYSHCADLAPLYEYISLAQQFTSNVIVLLNSSNPIDYDKIKNTRVSHCLSKPINHNNIADALLSNRQIESFTVPIMTPRRQRKNISVLAVDDNPANLKLISAMLSDCVRHLSTCVNGQEAVECAKKQHFDIIFMDIQMPILDGINASRQIKNDPMNANTPIIAVTAHIFPEEKSEYLQKGMNDCLAKPIDESVLENIINIWTKEAQQHNTSEYAMPIDIQRGKTLCSFDWKLALKQSAGKADLAQEMITMLLSEFTQIRGAVNLILKDEMPQDKFQELIHRVHGGCCYSGVPKLRKIIDIIEQGLKQAIEAKSLEPELLELLDELDNIERESREYLI